MTPNKLKAFGMLLILAAAIVVIGGNGLSIPGIAPKVTAVTYVCDEKSAVPAGVSAALSELNSRGIIATKFTDDATDGDDQVPEQYKVTLPAAKKAGLPCLVVQAGERVLQIAKGPTTKQQVLEAAQ